MNQVLIVFLMALGISLRPSDGADCTTNPCQLGGYFIQENGYQCIQIDPLNALCTCPTGAYEFNQPCRVCNRVNPANNACQPSPLLILCLESDDFDTPYACLCQGQSGVYATMSGTCDPSITLTTSVSTTTLSGATTSVAPTLPPCENGGVLINGVCNCPSGFDGSKCELKQNEALCTNIVCQNNGVCAIRSPNGPYEAVCLCRLGFWGDYCQLTGTSGFCTVGLCTNGGQCRENVIGATRYAYCQCLPGYSGRTCENRYFQCSAAGNFEDSFMKEQGKYFTCTAVNGGFRLEQKSCPKGLRFNTSLGACAKP